MTTAKKLPKWLQELNAKKQQKLTAEQEEKLDKARKYAKEISEELILLKPKIIQAAIQAAVRKQQEEQIRDLSLFCRVYIGSVNFDITEQNLKDVFQSFGFIKSCSMSYEPTENRHKGFAFIDFDTPEAATLAIEVMDGALLGNRSIKVGRPTAFPLAGNKALPPPSPTRIYIANINEYLSPDEIQQLFSVLSVKQLSLVPDSSGKKHKGYGFIEFDNEEDADLAIQTFNGYSLADRKLRLCKAVCGGKMPEGLNLPTGKKRPISKVDDGAATSSATSDKSSKQKI
jgi:poly(U)-binding-splicing factor PUF60